MSSYKYKELINAKNYSKIRKTNFTSAEQESHKQYAVQKRILSIATILNKKPNFTTKRYKMKKSIYVTLYKKYYDKYVSGDFLSLGNATKLISFYLYGLIPDLNLLGNKTHQFKNQRFEPLKKNDINEKTIQRFKKIRQWPHLTLMLFPKHNNGSCHDYTILRAMYLESQRMRYKTNVIVGTNTLFSHIDIRKISVERQNRKLRFLLLTLFHVFRTYQTLKYITRNRKKLKSLEDTLYSILKKCTNDEMISKKMLQFLLTREKEAYKNISILNF